MFRWNNEFWRKHNQEFSKGKEDFVAKVSGLVDQNVLVSDIILTNIHKFSLKAKLESLFD